MKKPRLYLAYGSNMNLKQMGFRCPTAKVVDTAIVKDYQLLFRGGDGSAVATIEPMEGYDVPVAVWSLKKEDEAALDRYEGWPFLYRKEIIEVEINGVQSKAMAYVMNDGYDIGMPSAAYFNTIQTGYEDNGLDTDVLFDALDYSVNHMEQTRHNDAPHGQQMALNVEEHWFDEPYEEPWFTEPADDGSVFDESELDESELDKPELDDQDYDEPGFDLKM